MLFLNLLGCCDVNPETDPTRFVFHPQEWGSRSLGEKDHCMLRGRFFFFRGDVPPVFSQVGDWAFRTTVAVGFLGLQEKVGQIWSLSASNCFIFSPSWSE